MDKVPSCRSLRTDCASFRRNDLQAVFVEDSIDFKEVKELALDAERKDRILRNDRVGGLGNQHGACLEPMQVDVRQQRGDYSALRRPLPFRVLLHSVRLDAVGLQPLPYERQHAAVRDARSQGEEQFVVMQLSRRARPRFRFGLARSNREPRLRGGYAPLCPAMLSAPQIESDASFRLHAE